MKKIESGHIQPKSRAGRKNTILKLIHSLQKRRPLVTEYQVLKKMEQKGVNELYSKVLINELAKEKKLTISIVGLIELLKK